MNREWMKARAAIGLLAFSAVGVITARAARADVVTDWNENTQAAIKTANTAPAATARVFAIVHAAVFDALNGIERRYVPYHVDFDAPKDASRRAAAVQAAYGALVKLFPAQKATLDVRRAASLALRGQRRRRRRACRARDRLGSGRCR